MRPTVRVRARRTSPSPVQPVKSNNGLVVITCPVARRLWVARPANVFGPPPRVDTFTAAVDASTTPSPGDNDNLPVTGQYDRPECTRRRRRSGTVRLHLEEDSRPRPAQRASTSSGQVLRQYLLGKATVDPPQPDRRGRRQPGRPSHRGRRRRQRRGRHRADQRGLHPAHPRFARKRPEGPEPAHGPPSVTGRVPITQQTQYKGSRGSGCDLRPAGYGRLTPCSRSK